MNISIKILLSVGLSIFIYQAAKAQSIQSTSFLQSVGTKDSLYSEILGESRTVYIHTPTSYDPNKDQKYSVLYVLDGEIFLPTVYEVQKYYSGGFTPEMVLVGISNENNRVRDLTPSIITLKYGMPFNQPSGGAKDFSQFIEKELIPFIEEKYPVTTYRTLVGHSYGGLFALNMLLHQPNLFANYLAIDPSLDWDDQKLLEEARRLLSTNNYASKALFMSLSGQLHMQNSQITIDNVLEDTTDYTLFARANLAFSNLLKKNKSNGLNYEWKFYPNDIHGTILFPSIMDGLIRTFRWYQMENTDKINSFDTSRDELYAVIKHREKKLKDHFGYSEPAYPEELLNMSGYMNMEMNQVEKAKMYFEFAIEYFPESANAYDSMADFYESQKDYVQALKFIKKASELSEDEYYKSRVEEIKSKL